MPFLFVGAVSLVALLTANSINKKVQMDTDIFINNTTIAATINPDDLTEYRIRIACSLAMLVGVFQLVLALSGLGILANYFSDTFISSYTCGGAIHTIVIQIKDLLGIRNTTKHKGAFNIFKVYPHSIHSWLILCIQNINYFIRQRTWSIIFISCPTQIGKPF